MCPHSLTLQNPRLKSQFKHWKEEGVDPYGGSTPFSFEAWYSYVETVPPSERTVVVPCGKCYDCFKKKASAWRVRLLNEYMNSSKDNSRRHAELHTIWCTLTFSSEYYVDDFDEQYEMIAWRIKCLRDSYRKKYKKPLRYWFCTERGKLGRIHLHGFIFDNAATYKELSQWWSVGNVNLESIAERARSGRQSSPYKAISYATKYIHKDFQHKDLSESRVFCSQGLGPLKYERANRDNYYLLDNLYPYIRFGKFKYCLPRYYRQKIYTDIERLNYRLYLASLPPPSEVWFGSGKWPSMASLLSYLEHHPEYSYSQTSKQSNYETNITGFQVR